MKNLHLATGVTNTQIYAGGGDVRRTRIISLCAHGCDEVDGLVRKALHASDG